ncbi:MAG TPA: tRNA (adenosine(37)-N6)-threonylcarbamoyltransferase complex ATPase subunit type 1 TsaE [Polyangiaceae bacterium]|jgi:tRNA threonylcarbamoyladenosine biosynthesis protein TsaE|nr:tRNA (adenosine(37)-N6)-threonylcarbamoyltransferase complex ATPase subunit type 1 TsaE [Polyangiaceae bacterium]
MNDIELKSERDTRELAARVAAHLTTGDLVVLTGPLGSGKTYFTRALCRALGLPARTRVPSPTFTLVHEHDTEPPVSHADLYRLRDADDVRRLGLVSQRDDGRVLVVEWGEPYIDVLGGDAFIVELTLAPRRATLRATGERSRALLEALSDSNERP